MIAPGASLSALCLLCRHPELDAATLAQLAAVVAPAERAAAAKLRRRSDQAAVLVAHALVRLVVGRHAGRRVTEDYKRFCQCCGSTTHGRPALPGTGVAFSLSHTAGLSAVAATPGTRCYHDIGVDVEASTTVPDVASLGRRVFAPGEQRLLAALSAEQAHEAGLRLWVRKEAALKLAGVGISNGLAELDASTDELVVAGGLPAHLKDLHQHGDGWVGAIATAVPANVTVRRVDVTELLGDLASLPD